MEVTENNRKIAEYAGMTYLSTVFDSAGYEQYEYSLPEYLSIQVYGYSEAHSFLEDQFQKSFDWFCPIWNKAVKEIDNVLTIYNEDDSRTDPWPELANLLDKLDIVCMGYGFDIETRYPILLEIIDFLNQNNGKSN